MLRPFCGIILIALAILSWSACGQKSLLVEDENHWGRTEEGQWIIYRIGMSGSAPFTRVIAADENAKRVFLNLYPTSVLTPRGARGISPVSVLTADEEIATMVGPDKGKNALRLRGDLKGHTAVIYQFEAAPEE